MAGLILGVLAGAVPARGTIITIAFSGTIDFVEDTLPFSDSIGSGTSFNCVYSYDSETPDNSPNDPSGGGYSFPDYSMDFDIGELRFSTPDFGISILNHSVLDSYNAISNTPFDAYGVNWGLVVLTLRDDTATAYSSDALPVDAPDLADFDFLRSFALQRVGQREPVITGTVTSIYRVPEPSTFALLATGAIVYTQKRRRFAKTLR